MNKYILSEGLNVLVRENDNQAWSFGLFDYEADGKYYIKNANEGFAQCKPKPVNAHSATSAKSTTAPSHPNNSTPMKIRLTLDIELPQGLGTYDDAADFLQYHYAFGDETCFSDNPFLQEHIVPEVRTYDISPLDD